MIDGEILGDLDRRVGHVSDTHHCGLRLSIDEISKVIEVVSNGRIASIVDHHKKLKCGVVVTGRDELLHFQHVLALLHLNVFGPEHGNLVGIIESLVGDHQVDRTVVLAGGFSVLTYLSRTSRKVCICDMSTR